MVRPRSDAKHGPAAVEAQQRNTARLGRRLLAFLHRLRARRGDKDGCLRVRRHLGVEPEMLPILILVQPGSMTWVKV